MTKTISIRGEVKFKLIIYAMAVKSRRRFAIWCDFAVPAQRQSSPCNEENNLKEAHWYVARPYLRGRALMLLESLLFSPNFIYRQMNKIFSPRGIRAHVISLNTCRSAWRLEREARAVPVKQNTHFACEKFASFFLARNFSYAERSVR